MDWINKLAINGKVMLTFFGLNVIGMGWYSLVADKSLDGGFITAFGLLLGFYTTKKSVDKISSDRKKVEVTYDKD